MKCAKGILKGKFMIVLNAYSKKQERAQIKKNLAVYLKEPEKVEPTKHKIRRKEQQRAKINEIVIKITRENISETKSYFFFLFNLKNLFRESTQVQVSGGRAEGEKPQTDFLLSVEPEVRLDPTTQEIA